MQKKRPSIRSTITRISWVFFNIMDELKNLIPIFKSLIFSQYPEPAAVRHGRSADQQKRWPVHRNHRLRTPESGRRHGILYCLQVKFSFFHHPKIPTTFLIRSFRISQSQHQVQHSQIQANPVQYSASVQRFPRTTRYSGGQVSAIRPNHSAGTVQEHYRWVSGKMLSSFYLCFRFV